MLSMILRLSEAIALMLCYLQVFINSHQALAQTVVQHGPAYQSRPTFKLFHSDYASSGIWTVDSKSTLSNSQTKNLET